MKKIFIFSPLVAAIFLTACGGGGGSSGSGGSGNTATGTAVKGAAVKGPLANAAVSLHKLDANSVDGKGQLLDRGDTNANAAFSGVTVPASASGNILVEVVADADTIDLTTNAAPVITRLLSVTTAGDVAAGKTNYPTPLSTLVVKMALSNADSSANGFSGDGDGNVTGEEWTAALALAQRKVRSQFGFGLLDDSVDLLSSPPLITSDEDDQEQVVKLRTAVEAVAALMADMAETAKTEDPDSAETADTMFEALSDDLNDGQVDGKSGGAAIASFANIADVAAKVTQDPSSLAIPGSDKTVSQVASVVVDETEDTGVDTDTTTAGNTSPTVEQAEVESDIDQNGTPDSEDADIDGDGLINEQDDAPYDPDRDNDGVKDGDDAFPNDPAETADSDGDGVGDNADAFPDEATETVDSDGDGVGDNADAFPNDPAETLDSDGDGVGDNADAFENDPTETADSDGDGVGDNADAFPNDPTETADSDGDGVGDNADAFENDPTETVDSDGDGVGDNADVFPNDPDESVDTDEDGVGDNADAFPDDANETADSDGDGVGDNADAFPDDATKSVDEDGDGYAGGDSLDDPDDTDPCVPDANAQACTGNDAGAVWDETKWNQANWQ